MLRRVSTRIAAVPFIAIATVIFAFGQDPAKAAPESYKLLLENAWVKVWRVHYGAHKKVAVHDHSKWPAAYVYLNDAGPVKFTHTGWDDPVLTRRPVKAKSLRLSPTSTANETHSVENISDTDSDFVRIEFKTMKQGQDIPHKRIEADVYDPGKPLDKQLFDNDRLEVRRITAAAGSSLALPPRSSTLVVMLAPARYGDRQVIAGDLVWLTSEAAAAFVPAGTQPVELLTFGVKTPPAKRPQ